MSFKQQFSLSNKVVAITGGTGILGEAFVEALAEAGARIAILGRNAEEGAGTCKPCEKTGSRSDIYLCRRNGYTKCHSGERHYTIGMGPDQCACKCCRWKYSGGNDRARTGSLRCGYTGYD